MMKTWTFIEKGRWTQRGPWDEEPDKAQWKDPATGLDSMAVRSRAGSWCGYVGVAEGHRLYGIDDIMDSTLVDLEVHGGVTFAGACDSRGHSATEGRICHVPDAGEPDHLWWIGFDCAHAWDLTPAAYDPQFLAALQLSMRRESGRDLEYRTLDYVMVECAGLAAQIQSS